MNRKINSFEKIAASLIVVLFLNFSAFAQAAADQTKSNAEQELRRNAVEFLRETSNEVNNLRTPENRVSFASELAALMWFHDEKEARRMFGAVIDDFRRLTANYEMQINALNLPAQEDGQSSYDSDRMRVFSKFTKALAVRQQIATAIAEHEPQLALDFYNDTALNVANPAFQKQMEEYGNFFEIQLLEKIAEKDVDAALKNARKLLAKGVNYQIIGLMKKIYDKDADKGADFAAEVVAKMKSDGNKSEEFYLYVAMLDYYEDNQNLIKNQPNKKPLLTDQAARDVAELLAQQFLARADAEGEQLSPYLDRIEKYQPARAEQIRRKFDIRKKKSNQTAALKVEVPPPPAPNKNADAVNQEKLTEGIDNLKTKKLSDEERKKIVEQSRALLANVRDRDRRIAGLIALAQQLAAAGDKETALALLEDVRRETNMQPKNYRDFMENWMLAGAYSNVSTDKAFPIIEDMVYRINDTISAFVKVGEFIDTTDDMIIDGEVQIGSFGGDLTKGMLGSLSAGNDTIKKLAIADFTRLKSLTGRFDRPEARILAKMLVLRAVLGDESKKMEEDVN